MSDPSGKAPLFQYWDACIFLDIVEGPEPGGAFDGMIQAVKRGYVKVHTSVFTTAEVSFGKQEKENSLLDPNVETEINKLWSPTLPFWPTEVFPMIARNAIAIARQAIEHGRSIKGKDSIHLATAEYHNVHEFITTDEKLRNAG